ncbi:MAG TPA: hypothetical protein VD816_07700 [Ohtaekwangia sp.]|nr:hypothetical protein [Ohtaekwangia sp.]
MRRPHGLHGVGPVVLEKEKSQSGYTSKKLRRAWTRLIVFLVKLATLDTYDES